MSTYLVTVGDSVHWGQGLTRPNKLHTRVAHRLRAQDPGLVEHHMAHSGAVIGVGATVVRPGVDGEVPVGSPTILEQVAAFPGDPAEVDTVLVNGGINDVDIRNILNPLLSSQRLSDLIQEHCLDSMRVLLEETVSRFPAARTRIVVTAYYPILSHRSKPFGIPLLLESEGLLAPATTSHLATVGKNPVVEHCLLFWRESTTCLRQAVDAVNAAHPPARIRFVDPGFTERNAAFADEPWLFGMKLGLLPEDEVAGPRRSSCQAAIPAGEILAREQCFRASAGHPNVWGAGRYADAIIAALGL
jgi:pyruvate/2-oxoglutarate dehydrogenase complex dihydrolipoamide acyltransferase (E2) component